MNKFVILIYLDIVKIEDEGELSDTDKDIETEENGPTKGTVKGKRKLQTRRGSKLLQLQTKATSETESDTGEKRNASLLFFSSHFFFFF